MDKKLERANKEKVLSLAARKLESLRFRRTKPTFFTRVEHPIIEFVHLHKFSFDSSFCVHFGLRVLNDPFEAVALNGPNSDNYKGPARAGQQRYDFRFHVGEDTVERCAQNIFDFVTVVGEPWFTRWRNRAALIGADDSPLHDSARDALTRAMRGEIEEQYVAKTKELLKVI